MSKRFMQGLWLGIDLMLWAIVLFTHGSMVGAVFAAFAVTILGGAMVGASEVNE